MILGLLIIMAVGWIVMLTVQQQGFGLDLRALEAKQVAQGIQISPAKCRQLQGLSLVEATALEEKEYVTTVGFEPDLNQTYFCFYE